uniref:Uncharacterized protein n=1 Tax=Pseudonaja textilis TaxID=8673 RepID=A0A670ZJB8_PSETE
AATASGEGCEQLLKQMSYAMVGFISVTGVFVLCRTGAPYGRYASTSYGYPVPATLAWMVQEAPAFLFPGMLGLCSGGSRLSFWPNRFLLGLFLIHYFYRLAGLLFCLKSFFLFIYFFNFVARGLKNLFSKECLAFFFYGDGL